MAITLADYKVSDIDVEFCKQYLRIDWDEDDIEINLYLESAKAYMLEHTEKTMDELDQIGFATICLLKLVSDFYHNKMSHNHVSYGMDNVLSLLLLKIRTYNLGTVQIP